MADLTPEQQKRLEQELTKYAEEGATDDDLRLFRDEFIKHLSSGSVKKKTIRHFPFYTTGKKLLQYLQISNQKSL